MMEFLCTSFLASHDKAPFETAACWLLLHSATPPRGGGGGGLILHMANKGSHCRLLQKGFQLQTHATR